MDMRDSKSRKGFRGGRRYSRKRISYWVQHGVPESAPTSLDFEPSSITDTSRPVLNSVDSGMGGSSSSLSSSNASLYSDPSAKSTSPQSFPTVASSCTHDGTASSPSSCDDFDDQASDDVEDQNIGGTTPDSSNSIEDAATSCSSTSYFTSITPVIGDLGNALLRGAFSADDSATIKVSSLQSSAVFSNVLASSQVGVDKGRHSSYGASELQSCGPLEEYVPCLHHGLLLTYYCESCIEDICPSCHANKHKGHQVIPADTCKEIFEKYDAVREHTLLCIDNAGRAMDSLSSYCSRVNEATVQLLKACKWQNFQQVVSQMVRASNTLRSQLQSVTEEAKRLLSEYERSMKNLHHSYLKGDITYVLSNAKHVRRILAQLEKTDVNIQRAIYSNFLMESDSTPVLRDVIKNTSYGPLLDCGIGPFIKNPSLFSSAPDMKASSYDSDSVRRFDPMKMEQEMGQSSEAREMLLREQQQQRESAQEPAWSSNMNQIRALEMDIEMMDQMDEVLVHSSREPRGRSAQPSTLRPMTGQHRSPMQHLPPLPSPSFQIGFHTSRDYNRFRRPLVILATTGAGRTGLFRPWGVCCDKYNNVIIADRSNNRIQMFRTDGSHVGSFGSFGNGPGELNKPAGVAVDKFGRIVVVDKDNHRIQVFDKNGVFLFRFGKYGNRNGEFYYPWDVSCSSNGNIAVTDSRNHRVQIFSSDGVYLKKYGYEAKVLSHNQLDCPRGIHYFGEEQLYVTDFNHHRLFKLDFSKQRRGENMNPDKLKGNLFHRPQGMAQDAEGNLLVCDSRNNCVKVFSPNDSLIGEFGSQGKDPGQFERPCDVAVAPDGRVVVVDLDNNRVQIF